MRNLKKVIALVAVFAMLVSTVAFAQTYSDVADTDVFAEAVETLSALGILTGDDADNDGVMDFRPADTITRAEVAAIICRIQNLNVAGSASTPFIDVPSSHWASGYVAQAAGQGIVNGYGDGNFGPDDNVTYEQVIKMLMETLGYKLFADANGGYPSGYLAAAQRYEVLDGVVGGGVGAEANRGMVAQLVYNAIDTPLMEQTVYGSDNNWSILDGGAISGGGYRQFLTLLKRDLKVYKASGTITDNSITTGIDKEKEKEVTLTFDNNEVNTHYGFANATQNFLQGDVDADAFLGYNVTLFAKKNLDGTYTLVTAAKATGNNAEISFTLDLFDGIVAVNGGYDIAYLKDVNSTTESKAKVETGATILFNGIKGAGAVTDYFSNTAGTKIAPNPNDIYSGKVTLINNDTDAAYDVVAIEIATTGIVKQVSANGQVTFLNSVMMPKMGYTGNPATIAGLTNTQNLASLKFESDATDYIINLTKDGEAIDYTELAKWDVLSIVNADAYNVFDVKVLGDTNTVDAYVTATRSSNGNEYKLSDGNWYEVATNGYQVAGLRTGDAGRFYIDSYGKIVALDDDVEVEGVEGSVADNYAVVLQAAADKDTWNNPTISVQLLDKTGNIVEADFATDVTLYNLDGVAGAPTLGSPANTAEMRIETATLGANASTLAAAMVGEMISYSKNSTGAIKAITFPQNADNEEDLYIVNTTAATAAYDEEDMKLGNIQLDEDTLVFYITNSAGAGTITGYSAAGAKADYSRVATAADLAEGTYKYVAFDNGDDIAKAVIIYNTTGAIAPSANVAVIESIGNTVVNGTDDVYVVEYWMGGELQTATTAVDLDSITTVNAHRGDVFQMNVSNGTITSAAKIMDYSRSVGAGVAPNFDEVAPAGADFAFGIDGNGNGTIFGAITNISNRGSLTLTGANGGSISANDAETANVYVLDPNKREAAQLYVSSIGEAIVDDNVVKAPNGYTRSLNVTYDNGTTATIAVDGTANLVLLDYAFAYQYDGDAIDIVIYKAYEFDYTFTDTAIPAATAAPTATPAAI